MNKNSILCIRKEDLDRKSKLVTGTGILPVKFQLEGRSRLMFNNEISLPDILNLILLICPYIFDSISALSFEVFGYFINFEARNNNYWVASMIELITFLYALFRIIQNI